MGKREVISSSMPGRKHLSEVTIKGY